MGKPTGILTGIEKDAKMFIEAGMSFVAVGSDLALLARGSEALRAKFE
jgi:4-hydroxy-2-oxoheptanedioate aldolase